MSLPLPGPWLCLANAGSDDGVSVRRALIVALSSFFTVNFDAGAFELPPLTLLRASEPREWLEFGLVALYANELSSDDRP